MAIAPDDANRYQDGGAREIQIRNAGCLGNWLDPKDRSLALAS